jgi:hypothetical protein
LASDRGATEQEPGKPGFGERYDWREPQRLQKRACVETGSAQ